MRKEEWGMGRVNMRGSNACGGAEMVEHHFCSLKLLCNVDGRLFFCGTENAFNARNDYVRSKKCKRPII